MQIHTNPLDAKVWIESMKLSRSMTGDALYLLQGPSHVLSVGIGFRFAHMSCILGELFALTFVAQRLVNQTNGD